MLSINLSTKIQGVRHLPTDSTQLVALYCCLEPSISHVPFKRSYDFNTSSSNNFLKTSSHSKSFYQYNFNTQNYYYYYYNIVSCSLIILQIIHTMLHSLKLLIHHNYKGISYYYKTNFQSFTPNSIYHLKKNSLFKYNSLISSSMKFYFFHWPFGRNFPT